VATKTAPFIYKTNPTVEKLLPQVHKLKPNFTRGLSLAKHGFVINLKPTRIVARGERVVFCEYITNDRVFGFFYVAPGTPVAREFVLKSAKLSKWLKSQDMEMFFVSKSVSLQSMYKWTKEKIAEWIASHPTSQLAKDQADAKFQAGIEFNKAKHLARRARRRGDANAPKLLEEAHKPKLVEDAHKMLQEELRKKNVSGDTIGSKSLKEHAEHIVEKHLASPGRDLGRRVRQYAQVALVGAPSLQPA